MDDFYELTCLDTGLEFEQHKEIVKRVALGKIQKKLDWLKCLLENDRFMQEDLTRKNVHVEWSIAGDGWGDDNYYIKVFDGMSIIDTLRTLKDYLTDTYFEDSYNEHFNRPQPMRLSHILRDS